MTRKGKCMAMAWKFITQQKCGRGGRGVMETDIYSGDILRNVASAGYISVLLVLE